MDWFIISWIAPEVPSEIPSAMMAIKARIAKIERRVPTAPKIRPNLVIDPPISGDLPALIAFSSIAPKIMAGMPVTRPEQVMDNIPQMSVAVARLDD